MKAVQPASDEEVTLLTSVAHRDEAAFAALYDRYSGPAFGLVLRIIRSRAEAEEVLQEAFWQVWNRAPDYRPDLGSPFYWIITIEIGRAHV